MSNANTSTNAARRFKLLHPAAITVTFEGQEFPSVMRLGRFLATQYNATPEALCYWIRQRSADREMLDAHFTRKDPAPEDQAPPPPEPPAAPRGRKPMPVVYQGTEFPSRSRFVGHMAAKTKLPPTFIWRALYTHEWDIDAAHGDTIAAGVNGVAVNQNSPKADPAPDTPPGPMPAPFESVFAEMGETIGLIRGAYEARESTLAELRAQFDAAMATIGSDPALVRKLADLENRFVRQTAALQTLERQLASEHSSRAQIFETVGLINTKLTQLAHDLRLEKTPTPTRRDPTAG